MIDFAKLREPFPEADIEWRIQQSGVTPKGPYAMVLAYVTNRAIMERLDDVVGPENWQNAFEAGPGGGVLCGLYIKVENTWVVKWDGAENTDIESIKGGLSGSMKRAAVQWGIGRYLYNLEATFAKIGETGRYRAKIGDKAVRWSPPPLPAWALPKGG